MGDGFLRQESLKNENYVYSEGTIEVYNILDSYINGNLLFKKDIEYNLDELKKLSLFCNIDYNTDVFELLLQNNKILYNIVRLVIISNFTRIKENRMYELIDDEFILSLLDFYQALYSDDIEKIELFLRIANGDKVARNKAILDNKGLVCEIALKYNFSNVDIDDLISEGMLGLINAVDNFNLFENVQFSTYAFNCIDGFIKRFINTKEGTIRTHTASKLFNYDKGVKLLDAKLGREPNFDEIAKELKMDKTDICVFNSIKNDFFSLNSVIESENGAITELGDLIAGIPEQFIDSDIDTKKEFLYQLIYSNLPINYIYVLIYRYGLGNVESLTLEKIGDMVGIVKDEIRRLEENALKKIREIVNSYNYDDKQLSNNILFVKNKYSTRKIFCIHKSKVIRNMPAQVLNRIVENVVHYNLRNNNYLLEKKNQKNKENIKFSKIDNRILDIFSSFILEYDKIFVYDSLMELDFSQIKLVYLNYAEETNPKHLFVNETFNEMEKNMFFKLFVTVINNIKLSSLIFADFYEHFSTYTVEQVDRVIENLKENEKMILHLRFGNDLNSKVIYPLTKIQREQLEAVIEKLNIALEHEKTSERAGYLKKYNYL